MLKLSSQCDGIWKCGHLARWRGHESRALRKGVGTLTKESWERACFCVKTQQADSQPSANQEARPQQPLPRLALWASLPPVSCENREKYGCLFFSHPVGGICYSSLSGLRHTPIKALYWAPKVCSEVCKDWNTSLAFHGHPTPGWGERVLMQ